MRLNGFTIMKAKDSRESWLRTRMRTRMGTMFSRLGPWVQCRTGFNAHMYAYYKTFIITTEPWPMALP